MTVKIRPFFFYTAGGLLLALAAVLRLFVNGTSTTLLLALTAAAFIVFYLGGRLSHRKSEMKLIFALFFAVYVIFLTDLVLFDSGFGRVGLKNFRLWDSETLDTYLNTSFNMVPFKTVRLFIKGAINNDVTLKAAAINLVGNLAAFAPFAFFLPLLFRGQSSFLKFSGTMLFIVCLVELLQFLLMTGACDIDDLILNMCGAMSAYLILRLPPVKQTVARLT